MGLQSPECSRQLWGIPGRGCCSADPSEQRSSGTSALLKRQRRIPRAAGGGRGQRGPGEGPGQRGSCGQLPECCSTGTTSTSTSSSSSASCCAPAKLRSQHRARTAAQLHQQPARKIPAPACEPAASMQNHRSSPVLGLGLVRRVLFLKIIILFYSVLLACFKKAEWKKKKKKKSLY